MDGNSLKGQLLVSAPFLGDPNFDDTVVFMIEHTPEGAFGVVINRPSDTRVAEVLEGWEIVTADPAVVFVGGPVQPEVGVAVARIDRESSSSAWQRITPTVGVVDLGREPIDLIGEIDGMRIFTGYAGWGPGQVEGELAMKTWFVLEAEGDDVVTPDPGQLWADVLRRQGGRLATYANTPDDPSFN